MLIVGDSRARGFSQGRDGKKYPSVHCSWRPGATTLTTIALAKCALEHHPEVEILILLAGHCDLTTITPWSRDRSYKIMKTAMCAPLELARTMAQATSDFQRIQCGLLVVWTLPYIPDFHQYNLFRIRLSSSKSNWTFLEMKTEEGKYHHEIKRLSHYWWNYANMPPFHLSRLHPRHRANTKLPKRFDDKPFGGKMRDGLHPEGQTIYRFWNDVLSFARRLKENKDKGQITALPSFVVPFPQGASLEEEKNIKEKAIRNRHQQVAIRGLQVTINESGTSSSTNTNVVNSSPTKTLESTIKYVRKRRYEEVEGDTTNIVEEFYMEESRYSSMLEYTKAKIQKTLEEKIEKNLKDIDSTLDRQAHKLIAVSMKAFVNDNK